jgi:hypothetical protein
MPPIASSEIDDNGVALLDAWITQELPNRQTYGDWRQAFFHSDSSPEGEPDADPETDGHSNMEEFLEGTNPLDGGSFLRPSVDFGYNTAILSFDIPANRSAQVETSTDLIHWSLWDTPANNGMPLIGGHTTIEGPILGAKQFFRLKISDN